jgi:cell division protein FtsN
MADNDNSFDLEEDSSLEKFEEELLHEEKKKARSSFLIGLLVLVAVGGGVYYVYTSFFSSKPPPPPKIAARAVKPPVPAPAPPTVPAEETAVPEEPKPVAPAPEPEPMVKAEEKPAAPEKRIIEETLPGELTQEATEPQPVVPAGEPGMEMKTATPKPEPAISDEKTYTLQVGFFRVPENADRMSRKLKKINLQPRMIRRGHTVKTLKVYTGEYIYRETAAKAAEKLSNEGFKPVVALTAPGKYELEMGSFQSEAEADNLVKDLEDRMLKVRLAGGTEKLDATFVLLENIGGTQTLEEIKELLKKEKIDFFIVRR